MFREGKGTNRVSQAPSRQRLAISSEAESTTSGGNLPHGSRMRTGKANLIYDNESKTKIVIHRKQITIQCHSWEKEEFEFTPCFQKKNSF